MTNQNANTNQNQTKGAVVQMKTVNHFAAVNYKAEGAESLVAQFSAALVSGESIVAKFRYGHSVRGGSAMYLAFEGKAPQRVSVADFYKRLESAGVKDLAMVKKAVAKLSLIRQDKYVVGHCSCGAPITAANVDYIQRNFAKFGITEFDGLCYKCQRNVQIPATATLNEKTASSEAAAKPEPKTEEKVETLTITKSAWDKAVNRIKELEAELATYREPSMDELADVWGKLVAAQAEKFQTAERSEAEVQAEANVVAEQAPKKSVRKCSICREEGHTKRNCPNKPTPKSPENEAQREEPAVGASEASAGTVESSIASGRLSADDLCLICDVELPERSIYNLDMCPHCIIRLGEKEEYAHMIASYHIDEAKAYLKEQELSALHYAEEQEALESLAQSGNVSAHMKAQQEDTQEMLPEDELPEVMKDEPAIVSGSADEVSDDSNGVAMEITSSICLGCDKATPNEDLNPVNSLCDSCDRKRQAKSKSKKHLCLGCDEMVDKVDPIHGLCIKCYL